MMRSVSVAGIALLLMVRHASSQAVADRPAPRARGHHSLFYDEARQRVLLTGGAANKGRNYTMLNDLWSFDGSAWKALVSSGDSMSGIRVDADRQGRIYSLGGYISAPVGDLRVLENDRWRRVGTHPSVTVAEGGFAFDAARNRFVAFGGGTGSGQLWSEVWEYDGTTWEKSSATPPPARGSHAMVYDARRNRIVVFGGQGVRRGEQPPPMLADTWEFDGKTWSRMPAAGPAGRLGAGATYDSKRGLVLVFGGANHDGVFNDLWSWDGSTWKKLAEGGPEPRVMGYIAYDKTRDRVVLFGGRRGSPDNSDLGDTWEWDGATWRRVH